MVVIQGNHGSRSMAVRLPLQVHGDNAWKLDDDQLSGSPLAPRPTSYLLCPTA